MLWQYDDAEDNSCEEVSSFGASVVPEFESSAVDSSAVFELSFVGVIGTVDKSEISGSKYE